jgi:acetolactate synthase small subunit
MAPWLVWLLLGGYSIKEVTNLFQQHGANKRQFALSKEELNLQRKQMENEAKGTEKAYKAQRDMASDAYDRARIEKTEDRIGNRELMTMQFSKDSSDRQTAMMLSMIQNIQNSGNQMRPSFTGVPSIPELLR